MTSQLPDWAQREAAQAARKPKGSSVAGFARIVGAFLLCGGVLGVVGGVVAVLGIAAEPSGSDEANGAAILAALTAGVGGGLLLLGFACMVMLLGEIADNTAR